jgi:tripartite-type tricarboxylate transporter receptor subunit TctC
LNREIAAAMADPSVRSRFADFGAEPLATSPEELGRHISSEIAKWRDIIHKGGITLEP